MRTRPPIATPVALAASIVAAIALLAPAAASAHARVSPAVSVKGELQLYSLAVPTEKESATTRQGRDDSSVRVRDRLVRTAAAGLDAAPAARQAPERMRSFTPGDVDGRQDADRPGFAVPVPGPRPPRPRRTRSLVQQTYSDGSIVNWSGSESSDAPAPTIDVKDLARRLERHLGAHGRRADRRRAGRWAAAGTPWVGRGRGGSGGGRPLGMTRLRAAINRSGRRRGNPGAARRGVGARVPDQDRPGRKRGARIPPGHGPSSPTTRRSSRGSRSSR